MSGPLEVNFNTPGAADAVLRSPDGWVMADSVVIDTHAQTATFYQGKTVLGTITWTTPITRAEQLHIDVQMGFRVMA